MASERLSDQDVAFWAGMVSMPLRNTVAQRTAMLACAEVKEHRALLTPEDVEALRWLANSARLAVSANQSTWSTAYMDGIEKACSVIDKLLAQKEQG